MQFVNFAELDTEPFKKEFQDDIIDGTPEQNVWSHFVGANGAFKSGMWDSTAGIFRGPMTDQIEFCHILEGEARIETEDGASRAVRAGDAFVMDNGLQPVWHIETYIRKHYVIVSV
ncbi:cupin domain-containing protein [uncultured Roseobacter sp.]|uniref:cupin domain-containing protein n=1 Tax=uncultured Roseobacter sp. TaxID=114847 RepID=UPI00262E9550|nr:cupin domain-containing protein [uncultured Roseobacter sp.]